VTINIESCDSFQDRPPCYFVAPGEYENLFPTLEKGGQGGFEMDGQPIESLSISLYPKGEVFLCLSNSTIPQFHNSTALFDSRNFQDRK